MITCTHHINHLLIPLRGICIVRRSAVTMPFAVIPEEAWAKKVSASQETGTKRRVNVYNEVGVDSRIASPAAINLEAGL